MAYKPQFIVIHHSAGQEQLDQLVRAKKYHIVIDDRGAEILWRISVPHSEPSSRAVGGFNSKSFSICVIGNYSVTRPSDRLKALLVQLCAAKVKKFGLVPLNIVSHGYVGRALVAKGSRYSTECCGVFLERWLPELQDKVRPYLRGQS